MNIQQPRTLNQQKCKIAEVSSIPLSEESIDHVVKNHVFNKVKNAAEMAELFTRGDIFIITDVRHSLIPFEVMVEKVHSNRVVVSFVSESGRTSYLCFGNNGRVLWTEYVNRSIAKRLKLLKASEGKACEKGYGLNVGSSGKDSAAKSECEQSSTDKYIDEVSRAIRKRAETSEGNFLTDIRSQTLEDSHLNGRRVSGLTKYQKLAMVDEVSLKTQVLNDKLELLSNQQLMELNKKLDELLCRK